MVALGATRMTLDHFEVARAELVEALARMVNRVIQHGKAEAQSALRHINVVRTILAEAGEHANESMQTSGGLRRSG
jgi:hypothetical protein